jgi:4-amino-4-deoxy-L-arabinose transferase-like glycosyltransferase
VIVDLLALLATYAAFAVAGLGVTRAVGWWGDRRSWLAALPLAYLVGVAAYGVAAQLLLVLGLSLPTWQVLLLCGLLAATGLAGRRARPHRRPSWTWLAAPALAMLLLLALDLWFQPLWSYDAWVFWVPKGKALVDLGGLDASWFTGADLMNPDYPLLVPAIEAAGFRLGGYETQVLDFQAWLMLVALVGVVAQLAAERSRSLATWAVLTMVVFAPATIDQLAESEADIPLATLFAAAGLCGWLWLVERDRPALALAAMLGAGGAATKVEGVAFVAGLFAILAVLGALHRRRDAAPPLIAGLAAFALGVLPWRLWLAAYDVENQASVGRLTDVGTLADDVGRVPKSLAVLVGEVLDPRRWLLLLPFAAFAVVLAARRGRRAEAVFVAAVVALGLAGLVLAYWTTPFDLQTHLDRSARRVVTGLVLFAAALTPFLLVDPRDAEGGDDYPLRP